MEVNLEEILKILSTPLALRTSKMISVLVNLTKEIDFFVELIRELGEKMHYQTCEYLCTEYHPNETILFNEGDKGSTFFIILQGKVKVVTTQLNGDVAEQAELAYLSAGNSFGELALIKNQPRKATIICLENCYFMTLSKENYLRILGKFFSKKLDEKIDFLHSVKIFNKWSKKSIERIHFFFKPKTFKKNEIIYKIGEEPYGVYFIVSGVIELTIDNNQTALADFPKSLKVALITDKDVLGDEEILLGINRKYNAKCYSKVLETFWISKEDFLEQINKESLKKLKIRNFSRDYIRSSRLKSVQTSHAKLRSPSIPKKKEIITKNYFTINKNFITNTKTHRQNSNFSNKLIESIKKKSKLDTPSPTSSILVNCTVSQTPRVTNFFHNSKGFQPFKNNPSGVFKKISDRIKYLYML